MSTRADVDERRSTFEVARVDGHAAAVTEEDVRRARGPRPSSGRPRLPPCIALGPATDHWPPGHAGLPAIRAITHAEGKAIRLSRRARRGAGCWLRTTMGPPAAPISRQPDCVAGGVGGPSSSHRARMPGWASRWGRVRSATLRTIQRRSTPGAGLRRCRPRLRSSARARTARSRVVRSERPHRPGGGDCIQAKAILGARRAHVRARACGQ
jgi:hypothetical protein